MKLDSRRNFRYSLTTPLHAVFEVIMRLTSGVSALCALTIGSVRVSAEDSDVVDLTNDSFADFVGKNKHVLVEFYAPWCGHCKALAPHYENAATQLATEGSDVKLAKVDATVEKELGEKYEVRGYPTLLWFVDGQKLEYDGGRTAEGILSWIKDFFAPSVHEGPAPAPTTKPVVVLKAPKVTDDFQAVAAKNRKAAVFYHETAAGQTVTIQHKGEDVVTASADELKDLAGFVKSHSLPVFGALDGETYGKYMDSGKGLVWVLLPLETSADLPDEVDKVRSTFVNLGKQFTGYKFTYIDTIHFKSAVENMLGVSSFPAVVVHKKAGDKKKFVHTGALAGEAVSQFLKDVESGKVQASLKSESLPEANDEPVRVVVGSTLEKEAFNPTKDVLLEVYAPWCGHCKKLAPEWEKVAAKVRKEGLEDIITIAKMDGTTNDSPVDSITWEGFPTLFYIKAGSSTPQPFDGGRDAKAIWKWIKKNHSKAGEIAERLNQNKETGSEEREEL
jgi:protein disulfide isomerase